MGCVYVFESSRSDSIGEKSYPVYKIGRSSKSTSASRTKVTTLSTNDITTLAEIITDKDKEKDWENLLHYVYKDEGKRLHKIIDGRSVKSEWFKITWHELKKYLELVGKATNIKIKFLSNSKIQNNSKFRETKSIKNNILDAPTDRYLEYWDLGKKVLQTDLQNDFKSIKLLSIIKPSATKWTKLNDSYAIRTNHSSIALNKDIEKLKTILKKQY